MSSRPPDPILAAKLLERLLTQPAFRADFRRDPVATCARFGVPELGPDVERRGRVLDTLELRESRSSLAGALAAVAAEAVGLLDLTADAHANPHTETGRAMTHVLTRLDLPAIGDSRPPATT